jgi:hypothetical protein
LEELKEAKPERATPGLREEIERSEFSSRWRTRSRELSKKMNLFLEKMGELYEKMDLSC